MRLGPWEIGRSGNSREPVGTVGLTELLNDYDIVDIQDDHMVVAGRKLSDRQVDTLKQLADASTSEVGHSGMSHWGSYMREEYNSKLRGKEGLVIYDQMRRSSAQTRMSLRILKTPVIGARWFVQPTSDSKRDRKIALEIQEAFTKRMSVSWWQVVLESLLMLDFGFYNMEKVFKKEDDKIWWRKLAPRHPLDIYEFKYDSNGGPAGIDFFAPEGAPGHVYIPIEKLLVFTFDKEGGDMQGISALRSAYPHWYIIQQMYKIDAIQKERHGIGIPIIKLPPGYSPADKDTANALGRNLRTNEKAHVVLPPFWEILMLKMEGQPVDLIRSIEHHNDMILNNVLAAFITMDNENKTAQDMFQKGTRFIADIVRDTFNKYAIPELVRYNYGPNVEPPELKVRRIGDTVDWRTLSFAVRNLIGAKVLTPSPELEEWFRDEMDLPPMTADDMEIAKAQMDALLSSAQMAPKLAQKQLDSNAENPGLPRQSPASGMKQAQGTGSNGKVGEDSSGKSGFNK